MEIRREVVLPVSPETARRHLAAALATPLVVQQGNLILAKIICSGRIKGNELWVRYIEYGRSTAYIDLTGHLEETPDGVRLHITVSSDETPGFLVYLPLAAVSLFLALSSINSGLKLELLANYFLLVLFGAAITFLMRSLNSSFSQMRIAKLEGVLVQIIMG
ncbi:MAG: hypothetical protein H7Z72_05010 [Bacteroidetes bacterium]|nr:hypothetical protein [Fibrella sp.]